MLWNITHDHFKDTTTATATVNGVRLTITGRDTDEHPATLWVRWNGETTSKHMRHARTAFRVADRLAARYAAAPNYVAGALYTAAELDRVVELWAELLAHPHVTASTSGYYGGTVHLSPGVTGYCDGNAYRMPNAEEVRALVLSDGEDTTYPATDDDEYNPWDHTDRMGPVEVTLISCGDYHGSDVDAANNRTLDGMAGVTVRYPGTGGMGSVESVSTVQLGAMSSLTDPEAKTPTATDVLASLSALVATMGSLLDYPLLDDDALGTYLRELADDAWAGVLSSTVTWALDDLNPDPDTDPVPLDPADPRDVDQQIRDAYYGYDGNVWAIDGDGATNIINREHRAAVAHAARVVFGWQ